MGTGLGLRIGGKLLSGAAKANLSKLGSKLKSWGQKKRKKMTPDQRRKKAIKKYEQTTRDYFSKHGRLPDEIYDVRDGKLKK